MASMKEMVEADKEIKEYLDTTNKSEQEKNEILERCWKDDNERAKWLAEARKNKPKPKNDEKDNGDKKKAAASHNDGHQQMRDAITAIETNLIARARNEVRQAVEYGGISPMVAAQDAASQAITKAVEEIRAATTLAFRK